MLQLFGSFHAPSVLIAENISSTPINGQYNRYQNGM